MQPISDNFRNSLNAEFSETLEIENKASEEYLMDTYQILLGCGLSKTQAMSIVARSRVYAAYKSNAVLTHAIHRVIDLITRISFNSH